MKENPLNTNAILELIFECLRKNGFSPESIIQSRNEMLGKYGVEPKEYAEKISPRIWQEIVQLTSDDNIGLHLAEQVAVTGQTIITYMTMSSESIGAGLEKAIRYQTTLSYATRITLKRFSKSCRLYFSLSHPNNPIRQQSEFFILALLKWFSMMLSQPCNAHKIQFHHQLPEDDSEQRRLLGENIAYSCTEQYIEFDTDFWAIPSPFINPQLAEAHEQHAKLQQGLKKQYLFLLRVKSCIIEHLNLQQTNITTISSALNLNDRQLQMQLTELGGSYSELLEDTRQELATKLLSEQKSTISEVAFQCGYAEPSVFNRAFKRWHNITPRQYQKNLTIDSSA